MNETPAPSLAHLALHYRFNELFAARQLERESRNRSESEARLLASHSDLLIPYPHGPSLTIERAKSLARVLR